MKLKFFIIIKTMSRSMGFSVTVTDGTEQLRNDFLYALTPVLLVNGFIAVSATNFTVTFHYTEDIRYYFVLFCDAVSYTKSEAYNSLRVEVNVGVPFNVVFPVI